MRQALTPVTLPAIVVALLVVCLVRTGHAADPVSYAGELEKTYSGHYRWAEDTPVDLQGVIYRFTRSEVIGDVVRAEGFGVYTTVSFGAYAGVPPVTIELQALLNLKTFEIQLIERNPDAADFVNEGTFNGFVSRDFLRIRAVWNGVDGKQGYLFLNANEFYEEAPEAPAEPGDEKESSWGQSPHEPLAATEAPPVEPTMETATEFPPALEDSAAEDAEAQAIEQLLRVIDPAPPDDTLAPLHGPGE